MVQKSLNISLQECSSHQIQYAALKKSRFRVSTSDACYRKFKIHWQKAQIQQLHLASGNAFMIKRGITSYREEHKDSTFC